ncbi:MAG: LPP20 family lipoprotein [Nitrospirae bacterium]|nr:LPP20 family lipoprotein [Nitrospirota bacterium]
MKNWKFAAGALALLLMAVPACGGKNTLSGDSGAPAWVNKGSGAFKDAGKKVFYGVGVVQGIKNPGMQKSTAENRARAEISKQMETYSASLMKDYMAATSAAGKSSEEQHVEQAIKTVSATTLSGVMIVDYWRTGEDGDTLYALAKLDFESFQNALGNANELSAQAKEAIKANADKSFDSLSKEEKK